MAAYAYKVYIDYNNYIYIEGFDDNWYLIKEDELQYIHGQAASAGDEFQYYTISEWDVSNLQNNNPTTPYPPVTELTEEQYNQIQNGTFSYGIPTIISIQPNLTYDLTWGTGNVYQKLSGKTYTAPNGQIIDCSIVTVTFFSSKHFKKFYATAVKDGKDYGFIEDVLVDIREINPTGVLLYELTSRDANVNFSFTINTSQLIDGDGAYRIGLYIQDDNNIWNYEYFLLDNVDTPLESSDNYLLQVPVQRDSNIWGLYKINSRLNTAENDPLQNGSCISAFILIPSQYLQNDYIILRSNKNLFNYNANANKGDYLRFYSAKSVESRISSAVFGQLDYFEKGYDSISGIYSLKIKKAYYKSIVSTAKYFRFCSQVIPSSEQLTEDWFNGCILTINEEI